VLEVCVRGSGGAGNNLRVLVNGKVGAVTAIPNATGSSYFLKLTFPATGTRRITIETVGVPCNGFNVASVGEITTAGRVYPLATLISDSFWEGTGSEVGDLQSAVMGRALGLNCAIAAVGSTGLLNTGGNNTSGYPKVAWTHAERVTDLTLAGVTSAQDGSAAVPAIGFVGASVNDQGLSSGVWSGFGATLIEAVFNRCNVLIDAWEAARPGKPLIFFGPPWPSGQPNNRPVLDIYRIRDGVQRACAARRGVWFIDRLMPSLREGVYSTGTDQAFLYTGGLTGSDATHPTPDGHRFDGLWMADQVRRIILSEVS
jgi:hypothetical protein